MSDYVTFEGQITPMEWGDSVYTVLPLPDDVVTALNCTRVEGEIADHPVNLAITRAPVIDSAFLWTGKSLLGKIGIMPGDIVDIRLRPADPNFVDVAPDIISALRAAGKISDWDALTPGKQRAQVHQIETAKRAETRTKRIAALIEALS
ncbi:MAG: YdeI/OmpD-associated family protein [Pseudomonadota bacterium]